MCGPSPILRAREESKSEVPCGEEIDDKQLCLHMTQAVMSKGSIEEFPGWSGWS